MSENPVPVVDGSGRQNTPEAIFASLRGPADRKRLGQFFTPEPIARLMAEWVLASNPVSILDPGTGPGIFPRVIAERLSWAARILCVDIDELALEVAKSARRPTQSYLECEYRKIDFLDTLIEEKFEAVIANPPYLRHHDMSYDFDVFARVGGNVGVEISRLSNSYILFLLRCASMLKHGGRMCFIVPSEWTNSNFGQPVKRYLLDSGLLRRMAYFNHKVDLFGNVLTTSCILFMQSGYDSNQDDVPVHYVPSGLPLSELESLGSLQALAPAVDVHRRSLRSSKKWDALVQGNLEDAPPGFVKLGDLAATKRGIATGANDFFHLSAREATRVGIASRHLLPCVGKAADVPGLIFAAEEFEALSSNGGRSHLVSFGPDLSDAERRYVEAGVAQGLPDRHLLAARSPWYSMERRPPAPIWAAVFNRDRLRFIHNAARVRNLTTFHAVFPHGLSEEQIAALVALLNSPIVQRLAGQQVRVYGGGLRKFEPKDLLFIPVPDVRAASLPTLCALGEALRSASTLSSDQARKAVMEYLDELAQTVANEASSNPRTLL